MPPGTTLSLAPITYRPRCIPIAHDSTPPVQTATIRGSLGSLSLPLVGGLKVESTEAKEPAETVYRLSLDRPVFEALGKNQKRFVRSMWGLSATLLSNMAVGVSEGFTTVLRLVGIGYRALLDQPARSLVLKVGFSHDVVFPIPAHVLEYSTADSGTKVFLRSMDKQKLYEFAHLVKHVRKPNVYTGKGIYVDDEKIKLKEMRKK